MSGSSNIAITITGRDISASQTVKRVNAEVTRLKRPVEDAGKSLAVMSNPAGMEALSKGMRGVAQHSLLAFQNVTRLVGPMSALTGATSVAGIAALAAEWANFGTQLGLAARRAGVPVERLHALQGAAELAGSSAEAMSSGMIALNDSITNAASGMSPQAARAFQFLGIALRDSNGRLRTASELFPEVADKLAAVKNPVIQAAVATDLLGGAGEKLLPVLREGSIGLFQLTERARKYGLLTEQGATAANIQRQAQVELSQAVRGTGNAIAESIEPALTPLLLHMAQWIALNREWIAQDTGLMFGGVVRSLEAYFGALKPIVAGMEALGVNTERVAKAIKAVVAAMEFISSLQLPFILGGPAGVAMALWEKNKKQMQGAPEKWPVNSPNWAGMSAKEQGNYVNSPASQKFLPFQVDQPVARRRGGSAYERDLPSRRGGEGGIEEGTGGRRRFHRELGERPVAGAPPITGTATERAAQIIAGFEGFIPNAKWDVNHQRVGYGSDTITDPKTGAVSEVTANTKGVTREAAMADLNRRVTTEFMPKAAAAIGEQWGKLTTSAQAAITSVAYNYGRVPRGVVDAARTGDPEKISAAIAALQTDNEGINRARRLREAQIAKTPDAPGGPAVAPVAGGPGFGPLARVPGAPTVINVPPIAGGAPGEGYKGLTRAEVEERPPVPGVGPAAAGIGGGTGASPAEAKITGGVGVTIDLNGKVPYGVETSATATGNAFNRPPKVSSAMQFHDG